MMNMDELIADDAIEEEDQDEEILLEKPFNPADINITTKQLTIDLLEIGRAHV
jgi:hypothetical protein